MLPRQLLQRPLSQSVATAAAPWRLTPPAVLLRRSSPPQLRRSYSSPPPGNEDGAPSLFDQLFPEEARQQRKESRSVPSAIDGSEPGGASPWASHIFDAPPRSPPPGWDIEDPRQANTPKAAAGGQGDADVDTALRAKSMLILSAASKYLLESDFIRLGTKGKHVEGWIHGIVKVVQARDPDTLEPLGHYFILFDNPSAAHAYKEEFERIWRLDKTYIPGAHHKKDSERRQPVPAGLVTDRGEDVAALIRSFTLLPPSQRRHLFLDADASRPSRTASRLDTDGTFVDHLARRAGSRFLVLVSIDGDRVSRDTLRRAIESDGAARNLPWRVLRGGRRGGSGHSVYPDVDGDDDIRILPFGRSAMRASDRDFEKSLREQAERASAIKDDADADDDNDGGESILAQAEDYEAKYRRYPRFIVPFEDAAEAHRFVRCWHRREVVLRMAHDENSSSSSSNDNGNNRGQKPEVETWEESRIINASVLW